jgi:hypothetical protein
LTNDVLDNGDDRVIGHASFAGAIVVNDVAKTQRALLHSVLPTGLHFRFSLRQRPFPTRASNLSGAHQFRDSNPETEGSSILQVVAG